MLIILDGPDGSGKTTLAMALKARGCGYIHLTYRWPRCMFTYHLAAARYAVSLAIKSCMPTVIDRWWPSEIAYAAVYRGGSAWPLIGVNLDKVLRGCGGQYVFCLPATREAYLSRFSKLAVSRYEMFPDVVKAGLVYDEYIKILTSMFGRVDVSEYDLDNHGKDIDKFVEGLLLVNMFRRRTSWPVDIRGFFNGDK